jgi:DNA-nicking Smr family endonuclease
MGRKKKRKRLATGVSDDAPVVLPRAPEKLARPFAQALAGVKAAPKKVKPTAPAPSKPRAPAARPSAPLPEEKPPAAPPSYSYEDRAAFNQAFAGVAPLAKPARRLPARQALVPEEALPTRAPVKDDPDAAARARLAALVGGGVRFVVRRESDGLVEAEREGSDGRALRALRGGRATAEAELDLHGLRAGVAEARIVEFLRTARRERRTVVRIIHGKGLRSEDGVGVLGDLVARVLTSEAVAGWVLAFASTAASSGGTGAVLVRLSH